jgi:hypothetical protein
LKKTSDQPSLHARINDFYALAQKDHKKFIALTSANAEDINGFKKIHQALYPFAIVDAIVLKTMIRSNPGLILLKDGKVIMNWHHRNIPSYSEVKNLMK